MNDKSNRAPQSLRPALCAFPLFPSIAQAVEAMLARIADATKRHCNLVIFPEACLTGLELSWNPGCDLPRGLALDSPELNRLREAAKEGDLHIAFGWIERDGDHLFDSALLIDNHGRDALHYRRVSSGWRDPGVDTGVYRCGESAPVVRTAFGETAFLLCGDLFDDSVVAPVRARRPDLLLYPFARGISGEQAQQDWTERELPDYLDMWSVTAGTTLAANCVDSESGYHGGAYIARDGDILGLLPLGQPGLLTLNREV